MFGVYMCVYIKKQVNNNVVFVWMFLIENNQIIHRVIIRLVEWVLKHIVQI